MKKMNINTFKVFKIKTLLLNKISIKRMPRMKFNNRISNHENKIN